MIVLQLMKHQHSSLKHFLFLLLFLGYTCRVTSQDLDPRAYAKVPVKATIILPGFSHSQGGVVTDPTLPLENLEAKAEVFSFGVVRTFSLFGQTAQAIAVVPYGWIHATALVNGQQESADRIGFADMRFRLSVLLLGGKALTISEFRKAKSRTIIGSSVTVVAPSGEYFSNKLINLGTHRWSFKPEIALSQPVGKRWMIDFYTGVWLFTKNHTFYPGSSVRTQDAMISFQSHFSYTINPRSWVALDATYYSGGQSSVNEIYKDDRHANARVGATLAMPAGKHSIVKIAFSRGAIVRIGANFSTVSVGWATSLFQKPKAQQETQ